jgi:acetoin utilization protein AcuB
MDAARGRMIGCSLDVMKIRDVMQGKVVSIADDAPVKKAYELMLKRGFRHMPVVDARGKLTGVISDRDVRAVAVMFRKRPTSYAHYLIPEQVRVREVMTGSPFTVTADDEVRRAVELFLAHQIGCLPVLDKGRLAGIVTRRDLLGVLGRLLAAR